MALAGLLPAAGLVTAGPGTPSVAAALGLCQGGHQGNQDRPRRSNAEGDRVAQGRLLHGIKRQPATPPFHPIGGTHSAVSLAP